MIERSRTLIRLLLVALALSMFVSVPLSAVGATGSHPQSQFQPAATDESFSTGPEEVDPDQVRIDIALASDGSAEWTVEFWVRLNDGETVEAFESISDDIDEDPEPYVTRFADRMDSTVTTASNATGREMASDGFDVETERQSLAREYGVVRYTFDWHGFAVVDGSELRAGDAIEGFYLDDGTRLLISWPETYELTDARPDADDHREHTVIWRGSQTDFVTGEPRVIVSSSTTGSSLSFGALGLAVFGVLAFAVVAWYGWRGSNGLPVPLRSADGEDSESESMAERDTEDEQDPPEEFLSNEERVVRLLEEHGSRMKQQDVVSELGWTDAKTSKVVGRLRDEGKLESFRLGRENVLTLPDREDAMLESGEQRE